MKKQTYSRAIQHFLSLLLIGALLTACTSCQTTVLVRFKDQDGNIIGSSSQDNAASTEAPQPAAATEVSTAAPETTTAAPTGTTIALNETASTDIVDFTLKDAKLSYYASSKDSRLGEPIDADDGGIFQAAVGHVLVILTIHVKNKDRVTLNVNDNGWYLSEFKLGYKGAEYSLLGYDLNSKSGGSVSLTAEFDNDENRWTMHTSSNALLYSGESGTYRLVMVAGVDPDSLSDPFTVTVNVPSSADTQYFTYSVG